MRRAALADSLTDPLVDPVAVESDAIAGAIRTDFILSAEIIVITLGVVAGRPLVTQVAVMIAISAAMTVGVYGLVAAIVKLDDVGSLLAARKGPLAGAIGRSILAAAPWLLRGLSVAGSSVAASSPTAFPPCTMRSTTSQPRSRCSSRRRSGCSPASPCSRS